MYTPKERVQILRTETAGLEKFLSGLSSQDWDRPSACDQWAIADVVAHLTRHSQNYPERIVRALRGDSSPDAPLIERLGSGQGDPSGIAQRAITARRELGNDLLAEFIAANQVMDGALAKIGPQDWDKVFFRPTGSEPLRNIVDVFITERTIHGWDIRSRLEPNVSLSPECIAVIVQRIPQRTRWWGFDTGQDFSPLPVRYRFQVTSPLTCRVDVVVVTEEQQYMEVGSKDSAQVTFRCDGETFVFLMYGRFASDDFLSDGRLSFEGDPTLVAAFAKRFRGG